MNRTIFFIILIISFCLVQSCQKDEDDNLLNPFTDSRDGHQYKWVKIGDQIWMAENLAYLPIVSSASVGSSTDKYYNIYGYSGTDINAAKATTNYTVYGVLYNWPAALTTCPRDWHLPSDAEWTTLQNYLLANNYNYDGTTTENKIAKSMSAKTNWKPYSKVGTPGNDPANNNSSGFSGLPGGVCSGGSFNAIEEFGFWWSATEYSSTQAWFCSLLYDLPNFVRSTGDYGRKEFGFSVRCIKN